MNIADFVFFLPTRKGSQRVVNKNTRKFSVYDGGILELKIKQLLELNLDIPILLSTNDNESITIAQKFKSSRITIIQRPEYLCKPETNIADFIDYIPSIIKHDKHVFWIHATAPFVGSDCYRKALDQYMNLDSDYDSIMSVTPIRQFIWDPNLNDIINHDRKKLKWPQTQDLRILYEINHAFYINSIKNFINYNDRIGIKPLMYELNKLESFDIDWEQDFILAEKLFNLQIHEAKQK
jgi:CMP-N-acetylneuraminic acid synthetase